MAKTAVMDCNCLHIYQNKIYGEGKRLHNLTDPKVKDGNVARCTVCGKEKKV